jgi:rod shape determining protein RodA
VNDRRRSRFLGRIDWILLGLVVVISGIGILNLFSASGAAYGMPVHISQSLWFAIGSVVAVLTMLVDYKWFERWAYFVFGAVCLLLVAVLLVGTELNGSYRWLNFGFFMMQPSELLKVGVILFTARYLHDRDFSTGMSLPDLVVPCGIVGASVFLVLKQPDLGTSLIILSIFGSILLYQGLRMSSLMTLAVVGLLSIPVVWNFGMHDYQRERVVSFLNLDEDTHGSSWQVRQSIIAFGSGRAWGKGHVESTQIQKGFVPEHENDFVAANWGEERGFVGMAALLGLYFALIVWALRIASFARDKFGALVAVGVSATIFWHVFVNLGMVTGMLPVVGLTLPFMSAGGSSLVTLMFEVGLLMNVSIRRRTLN